MAQRRVARLDGVAWILLSTGLVVALALFSHEPLSARPDAPSNLLGYPGDWLARELFGAFGAAVYVLLASWFALVLLLLLRESWFTWGRRLVGWIVILPCAAVGADWLGPDLLGHFSWHGSGGAVGTLIRVRLVDEFNIVGSGLIIAGVSIVALLLAVDFVLFRIAQIAWGLCETCGHALGSVVRRLVPDAPPPEAATAPAKKSRKQSEPDIIPIQYTGLKIAEEPSEPEPQPEPTPEPAAPVLRIRNSEEERPPVEEENRFEDFELPPLTLLGESEPLPVENLDQRLREQATFLEKTFHDFGLNVRVVGINTGPVITQYEITLETGMRVNKVTNLADDLALHLKVPSVRIVAPIPGKNTVGIEVPNERRATVRLKELILNSGRKLAKTKLPVFLGKDTEGRPLVQDLADMPHLLIAGTTGTGKSVCLNSIITSVLMTRRPDEVKMIMIDPKMTEMTEYGKIPHMMHPVVTDMKKAEAILAWAVDKMEERYDLLSRCRVRHISAYNELGFEEITKRLRPETEDDSRTIQARLPYIVIVVDELADLMMLLKREVETHIIRLAQKSRAAGIHLVLATQKPTVDVITGLIKSNLPGRIAFKVASRSDSRVVLDEMGADKLLGKGDMLFLQPGTSTLVRAQGTFVSDQEITEIVQHLETDEPCYAAELVQLKPSGEEGSTMEKIKNRDELYEQAVEIVVREGRGSVSLLQRALGIGYGRAARLVDFMAEDGVVGTYNGSNAREVLIMPDEWERMKSEAAV